LHLNGILPEKLLGDGAVRIAGQAITTANLESVRRQVGCCFRIPTTSSFCPTVEEDVAFGPQQLGLAGKELEARVERSLAMVGLAGYGHRATHH
jgi:cobalt/nickel transport system ATP-binding protein